MRAWFALTAGDYRGVITAARAGADIAGGASVAAQLAGQEAKAWARIGDRRQPELALDRGRRILDGLPYPDNIANHFVVDPAKYDFYAMGAAALNGERKSLPTLLLVSRELARIVAPRRAIAPAAREYLDRLQSLRPELSTDG